MQFYLLLLYCLLMGQININFANNVPNTEHPLVVDNGNLLNIQTKLLKVQDDIIAITAALGVAENLDILIEKISALESDFQLIKEDLSNERSNTEVSECSRDARIMLNNHFNTVSSQLKNLQISLKTYKEKLLPSETVADIKAQRFDMAEEKLKQMKNFTEVSQVVQALYSNCSNNLDLLTNFTVGLKDSNVIYVTVKALQGELIKNYYKDPKVWILLARVIEIGVINNPNADFYTKQTAQLTDDALKNSIREVTLEILNESLSKRNFEINGDLYNLTSEVFLLDPIQSEMIIEEFVNSNYGKMSSKRILDIIVNHRYLPQIAKGISVLFWNIKDAENLNSDVTLKIASVLYRLSTHEKYKNLNVTEKEEVQNVIDNLPVCARNLFFLPNVCLWNKEKEEYLTAGNLTTLYDNSRRNIFSADPLPESHWYVNVTDDNFLFSSRTYQNEYLYAAAFNFNEDLRYVFNWIPGKNLDKQSEWSIELDDDYCFIKSAMYNEYLFSSNIRRPDINNLRYVFTWVPGHSVREPKFQWQIRNCD